MITVTVKSKYIHYGVQVCGKNISVSQDEIKMLQSLNVKYEIVKEEKPKEPKAKKDNDD